MPEERKQSLHRPGADVPPADMPSLTSGRAGYARGAKTESSPARRGRDPRDHAKSQ